MFGIVFAFAYYSRPVNRMYRFHYACFLTYLGLKQMAALLMRVCLFLKSCCLSGDKHHQALSACVHTRAAVGCRGSLSTEQALDLDMERGENSSQLNIKQPNTTIYRMLGCVLGCVATGCLILTALHNWFDYCVGPSNLLHPSLYQCNHPFAFHVRGNHYVQHR